jgi:hypothetical protein
VLVFWNDSRVTTTKREGRNGSENVGIPIVL